MLYQSHELLGSITTSSVTGDAQDCDGLVDKWVEVVSLSAGSVDIEVSTDGTAYQSVETVSASGWYELPQPATHVRINPAAATLTRVTLRAQPSA